MTKRFLTAEWRDLLILNYQIDPAVLGPLLPRHTELELFDGRTLVSLVGFRFVGTRVHGIAIPGLRDFEELNLRFYVTRRTAAGALRRGVCFVREIVPRAAVAWVARWLYAEPYRALPMRHRVGAGEMAYELRLEGRWQGMSATPTGDSCLATDRPDLAFITEHYWGYTRRSATRTDEYEVRHPVWRVRDAGSVRLDLDVAALYGEQFRSALASPPVSAFIAEGSAVEVLHADRL